MRSASLSHPPGTGPSVPRRVGQVSLAVSRNLAGGRTCTPAQVRNPEARGMETLDGPFMWSALPIAGFAIIEATDLADAIEKASHMPCAVAHGVVEVWPLKESP